MKYIGFILIFLFYGCAKNTSAPQKGFNQEPNWNVEATQWSSTQHALKTLVKDGKTDQIQLDTIDWQKELKIITETEWNSLATKNKFKLDSSVSELTGKKQYVIQATDSTSLLKTAAFTYTENKISAAYYKLNEENAVYGTSRSIHLIPNEYMQVSAGQHVTKLMNEAFSVTLETTPQKSFYLGFLQREDGIQLPIRFYVQGNEFVVTNGAEEFSAAIQTQGDSLLIEMPVFPTEFRLVKTASGFEGHWYNKDGNGYKLPFSAKQVERSFSIPSQSKLTNTSGDWHVQFIRSDKKIDALGVFESFNQTQYGTFLTRSGDYRSLEGKIYQDSFTLSAFDGSHAYLFTGNVFGDSITGMWYSGKSAKTPWIAKKDSNYQVPNADTLTYLKDGYSTLSFAFPDMNGNVVSSSDERFKNKPTIITIMGSWCPNCMDEAEYLKEVYNKYQHSGLQIVGLSFERTGVFEKDLPAMKRAVKDLEIPYTVLHAGKAGGKNAAEALPMLNHVIAFPTAIYINRNGEVVKIHTGFTGPGTGKRYDEFVRENELFLKEFVK